ncbi:hypothetical protein BRAS3843_1530016 [Bradyrhizobium sp. STM 3843]|nr:hypothetical protein BRAS3843_1530016 [Bradyrhizobium sp. STM 3843]
MPSTRSSAATKCISEVPGLVKHTSTPPATRVRTRLSAPFIIRSVQGRWGLRNRRSIIVRWPSQRAELHCSHGRANNDKAWLTSFRNSQGVTPVTWNFGHAVGETLDVTAPWVAKISSLWPVCRVHWMALSGGLK